MSKILNKLGFYFIQLNEFVFINNNKNIIIAAYIDNLLIFGKNLNLINKWKEQLNKIVNIINLGNIKFFLKIEITKNRPKREIFISQKKYIKELLNKFKILKNKIIKSLTIQSIKLKKKYKPN